MTPIDPHPGDPDAIPLDQLHPRRHEPLPDQRPLFGDAAVAKRKPNTDPQTAIPEADGNEGTMTARAEAPGTSAAMADHKGQEMQIPLDFIATSPLNPRKHFDVAELNELADSLLKHGQLQNVTVRPLPNGGYELIGGERRYRSAKIAGLLSLRCRVIEIDDDTAVELRGIENYRRSQLNAIEEAIWFQQMLDTGRYNQTTLGEYLKITPGQVSNRLRLLKLPSDWQDMVISGKIPSTYARVAAAWAHRPNVLESIIAGLQLREDGISHFTVSEFETAVVNHVHKMSRCMVVGFWDGPKFTLDTEQDNETRRQLDIEVCPRKHGEGTEDRAFNVELWDTLQAEAETARAAAKKAEQEADAAASESSGEPAESTKAVTVSRLNDSQLRTHFERHVAAVLAGHLKPDAMGIRIFLATLVNSYEAAFCEWLVSKQAGPESESIDDPTIPEMWQASEIVSPKNLPALMVEFLRTVLCDTSDFREIPITLSLMMTICDEMKLDPLAKWQPDEALLSLCSDDQLRELFTDKMAPEKSVKKWGRARLIKEALDSWPAGYLPILLRPDALKEPATVPAGDDDAEDDDQDDDDE